MINRRTDTGNDGFTLIEILFSVMIITVIATAIASSSINNINYALYNRQLANAHMLAESKLAEFKADRNTIKPDKGSEEINNTEYKWLVQYTDVLKSDLENTFNIELKELSVNVKWVCKFDDKEITVKEYICPAEIKKVQR